MKLLALAILIVGLDIGGIYYYQVTKDTPFIHVGLTFVALFVFAYYLGYEK